MERNLNNVYLIGHGGGLVQNKMLEALSEFSDLAVSGGVEELRRATHSRMPWIYFTVFH